MAFTYFFRDLHTLELICNHAIPELWSMPTIKIWDAGCAMGPEPYTLAMLLRERLDQGDFEKVKIQATDIDGSDLFDQIIYQAEYPWEQVQRIPVEIFNKYFIKVKNRDFYRLTAEIRGAVTFLKHDLLTLNAIGKDFGLIVCKNVLLHFNEQERIDVLQMFHDSLMDGGYLAMEQTQKLPAELADQFEAVVSNAQIYQKRCQ
ncbi:protein-glutamate O-methyltransferase CheR [Acetobacterium wieringae]|uniref:CheR family methyltransferase n=1 Tax=Acetobacterium wieringae TaxID=52694 RepID=UPI0026F10B1B|nr:CheR family methyltransferase [Acetobacterium wieringae]